MRFLGAVAAAIVIALAVTVVPATPAQASTRVLCVGYDACARGGYTNHGYKPKRDNLYWRMAGDHNCTNYVAYLLVKKGMVNVRPWVGDGNAYAWGDFTTDYRDSVPVVGAVAWWDSNRAPASSTGHVSYVEKVISKTEIIVSEDNWKGEFRWKRITKAGGGWPSAFIHFKDSRTPKLPAWSATQLRQSVWTDATKTTALTSTTLRPGSSAFVELTYRNSGSGTWKGQKLATAGPVGRASALAHNWSAPDLAATLVEKSVAPGKIGTFRFTVRIPADAASGDTWIEYFAPRTPRGAAMLSTDAWLQFGAVDLPELSARPTPVIQGLAKEGETLTAVTGEWGQDVTLSYLWRRDGVGISSALGATYTPVAADVGTRLTVTVTGTKAGHIASTQQSARTAYVGSVLASRLAPGERLLSGKQIISKNGLYMLTQRADGNLVIYDRRTMIPLWANARAGTEMRTMLNSRGQLVSSTSNGKTAWTSTPSSTKAVKAVLSDRGTLSLYTAGGARVWSSSTSGR